MGQLMFGRALLNTQGTLPIDTHVNFTRPMNAVPDIVASTMVVAGTTAEDGFYVQIRSPHPQGFTARLVARDASVTEGPQSQMYVTY